MSRCLELVKLGPLLPEVAQATGLDFDGKIVWQKNLQKEYGKDTLWWDLGTSPVLTKDLVVVACMQSGESYLVGLDKKTGKVVWQPQSIRRIFLAQQDSRGET